MSQVPGVQAKCLACRERSAGRSFKLAQSQQTRRLTATSAPPRDAPRMKRAACSKPASCCLTPAPRPSSSLSRPSGVQRRAPSGSGIGRQHRVMRARAGAPAPLRPVRIASAVWPGHSRERRKRCGCRIANAFKTSSVALKRSYRLNPITGPVTVSQRESSGGADNESAHAAHDLVGCVRCSAAALRPAAGSLRGWRGGARRGPRRLPVF